MQLSSNLSALGNIVTPIMSADVFNTKTPVEKNTITSNLQFAVTHYDKAVSDIHTLISSLPSASSPAAPAPAPTAPTDVKVSGKTFAEYTQLYNEYERQKNILDQKIKKFEELKPSTPTLGSSTGGGKPLTYSQSGGKVPDDFSENVYYMSRQIPYVFKNIFNQTDYQSKNPFYYRVNFDTSDSNGYNFNQANVKVKLSEPSSTEKDFVLWCARSLDNTTPQFASVNIQSYDEFNKVDSQLEKISIQPYNVNLSFYDEKNKKLVDGTSTDEDDKKFFSDTFLKLVYYLSLFCSSHSKKIVKEGTTLFDTGDFKSVPALTHLFGNRSFCRNERYKIFVKDYLKDINTNTSSPEISLKSDNEYDKTAMVGIIASQSQHIIEASLIPNPLPQIGQDKPKEPKTPSTSLNEAAIVAFTDSATAINRTQAYIDQQNSAFMANTFYPLRSRIEKSVYKDDQYTKKDISSLEGRIQAYKDTIDIINKSITKIKELQLLMSTGKGGGSKSSKKQKSKSKNKTKKNHPVSSSSKRKTPKIIMN
jgi:hypothetical protein